jgi:inner membrane transporter RhtA
MPVAVILIAMLSIQSGASLAKSLFPLVGAPGVTALRIALGTAILVVIFKPWRLRFKKSSVCRCFLRAVAGGDELPVLPLYPDHTAGIAVALEFTGPLAVALFLPTSGRFYLGRVGRTGLMVPAAAGPECFEIDLTGAALALGAGACWAVYILTGQRAGEEHGPATVALGSLIAAIVFVPSAWRRPRIHLAMVSHAHRAGGRRSLPHCPILWR